MMRWFLLALLLGLCGCDPYEAAKNKKLSQTQGCNVPFGTPADSVSEATVCEATPHGPSGFVTVKGTGLRSAYGDRYDSFAPNDSADPAGCGGGPADLAASRAFWAQVHAGLRERLIVWVGVGSHRDCADQLLTPELLTIRIVDWADLDATVALVRAAMSEHDICSPIAVEVGGVQCFVAL